MKEINKTVQDLKVEIEATKTTQTEEILEMENIGKRRGTTDATITNRIQEMEENLRPTCFRHVTGCSMSL